MIVGHRFGLFSDGTGVGPSSFPLYFWLVELLVPWSPTSPPVQLGATDRRAVKSNPGSSSATATNLK
ncbi:hypothetical protein PAPYR_5521 [Paratrimastix pyriformis]|uniref:Uncharacterized protein n=1 Tax=Paratrimastix pyriformis TaxID=342808 RepID=A0ABQ8UIY6_9EUKA|nr:hypothetical protein PAPYR_5521 [Paratrimastix pyriformis]